MLPGNIEKSGFHKGEYVGYANGYVWRIRRENGGWLAFKQGEMGWVSGRTLKEISKKLLDT